MFGGLLQGLFPHARFIHCVRDPRDTCLSCYFQLLTSEHSYAYDLRSLGHYYAQYKRLMEHWEHTLREPIFTVKYEDLVGAQETTTRALIDYCGLTWDAECLRFHERRRNVVTPSYDDVHQPIYRTSVARWKNYEPYIGDLLAFLES